MQSSHSYVVKAEDQELLVSDLVYHFLQFPTLRILYELLTFRQIIRCFLEYFVSILRNICDV